MKKLEPRILLRNLLIEIFIYSILIFAYFFLVLLVIDDWLYLISQTNLLVYALSGLGLIILQVVFLDFVTSYLLRSIDLDQFGIKRILDVFSNR